MHDGIDLGIEGIDEAVEIGAGGYGVVFRALQRDEGRTVAVRVLPVRPEAALRDRYRRECEILRALSVHPNIVTLFATGFTLVDQPFLMMEHMPNGSLADRIERDGRVPWAEAVTIVIKLADAVAVAHVAGILHRDIRPENVLISSGEPCLSDLGLARVLDIVEARTAPVSLGHAAPEVVEGRRPSKAADVYSLGSTLFEMLSGAPAFFGDGDEAMNAVLGRIAASPVPDLRRRGVPDAVCEVVEAAMSKQPAKRPGSAVAFADRLRVALHADAVGTSVAAPPAAAPPVVMPPVFERRIVEHPAVRRFTPPPPVVAPAQPTEAVVAPIGAPPEPEAPAAAVVPEPEPVAPPVVEPGPEPDEPDPDEPDPLHDPFPAPEPDPPPALTDAQALALREPELAESGPAELEPSVTGSAPELGPDPVAPLVDEAGYAPTPRLSPPPVPGAKPPVTLGGRVFEGDPDEPSRSRGRTVRFALGALVAFVSLVVLVIVLVDSSTSKVGTPTAPVSPQSTLAPPAGRGVPLVLPAVVQPSGLRVNRTWRLTGDKGERFLASVEITNPSAKRVTDSVIEVIPKLLASNVDQVQFRGAKPVVLQADPAVRFEVTLAPGARERVGYSVAVPATGVGQERLMVWKTARDREQAALDLLLAQLPSGAGAPPR